MNERDFVYWLQGFLEMSDPQNITPAQIQMIKDHIKYVFDNMSARQQIGQPFPWSPHTAITC